MPAKPSANKEWKGHYALTITETSVAFACDEEPIAAEWPWTGFSIIRTTVNATRTDAGKVKAGFDLLTTPNIHSAPGLRPHGPAHPGHHRSQAARQRTTGNSEIPA
ncbi:hypothetical protein [Arthrobacter sp. SIMBA_036]|uniref:hypothetical protein n=1 Tax=Arthrobacter sp. SIMBA_036 TaxID=3085778 RepID=UPI00397D53B6